MKALVVVAVLAVVCLLANCSESFAQDPFRVRLTPRAMRAYHACLYEAWIEDYCRGNSARPTASYDSVFAACVLANHGGRFPLQGRDGSNTDGYCWSVAQQMR
jgi:hypothetical protein